MTVKQASDHPPTFNISFGKSGACVVEYGCRSTHTNFAEGLRDLNNFHCLTKSVELSDDFQLYLKALGTFRGNPEKEEASAQLWLSEIRITD